MQCSIPALAALGDALALSDKIVFLAAGLIQVTYLHSFSCAWKLFSCLGLEYFSISFFLMDPLKSSLLTLFDLTGSVLLLSVVQ